MTYTDGDVVGVVAVLFALTLAGCGATPRERVANAERSYQLAANGAKIAVQAKLITGDDKLDALKFANDEANDALKDANAHVQADAKFDTEFWLGRVNSAVARLVSLTTKAKEKDG